MIAVPLLAAILISVAIVLWMAGGKNIPADQWLLTGVPAWLQALGTVGAAYIAWYAFGTWQRQERTRRGAELAEKVLHAASELLTSVGRRCCGDRT
jgi:threonine/homoserine/homoserine lactone efflux protein